MRPLLIAGAVAGVAPMLEHTLHAQGVTTVAVSGTVRMADGSDPDGTRVLVRSQATGFALETEVRRGRFLAQGLEPGGPYTITVRRIGAVAHEWNGVFLGLGAPLQVQVVLEPIVVTLDSMVITAAGPPPLSCCHGGTATTLTDSLVHRLPSLDRNVYDFLRLVPQLSTRTGFAAGVSGGGASFRLNSFLTNGVSERSLSGAQPPEFAGGRSLPFEAVREYQVLLAPFDVRYGDFTGALVNTVTRSGTNRFAGSLFGLGRSDALARGGELAPSSYERWQGGLSASGPIVRDRVQFLLASEFQRLNAPMAGPFVGQPEGSTSPVPVSDAALAELGSILADSGLAAGSGRAVENRNRIRSIFARVDAALPELNSRAVLWLNDTYTRDLAFSREGAPDEFVLSSTAAERRFGTRAVALQLYTTLRRRHGGQNELSVSRRSIPFESVPEVRQPMIEVNVPATTGGLTTLVTGTPDQAQGGVWKMWDLTLRDDLTLPVGRSHVAALGLEAELFRLGPPGVQNVYGTWSFLSLDSLRAGQADRFEVARDLGGGGAALPGSQFAAYAGDSWRTSERLTLTVGLRADLLALSGQAPYNPLVDSVFGQRTDQAPRRLFGLSPRLGFTWDLRGTGRDQLRGGIGVFSGRPPLGWLHLPRQSYGDGIASVRCGQLAGDLGPVPPFSTDPFNPPVACAGGAAPRRGDVELVAPHLGLARTLRGVLAYERRLPGGFTGTVEGLATWGLSDFAFVNLNLAGPQATDRRGRVLYGGFDDLGRARPVRVTQDLPSVTKLRSVSRNHSVQIAVSAARQFDQGISVMASYTWSRVRDAQTPLRVNTRGIQNWALHAESGRHEDLRTGISLNDVPHRVVLAGTWRAPWSRWLTEVSLLYVGESGSPFTWQAGGIGGRGDLNADGAFNDPVYLPRSASDPREIVFTGASDDPDADNSPAAQESRVAAQAAALEAFIERNGCLRRQRGRIVARNSCREPWTHTTAASLRQTIPIGSRALEAQLDVFNLLNLLDKDWGLSRTVDPVLLEHVGQTPGPSGQPEPVYLFVPSAVEWTTDESGFQLQFGIRYRF